MEYVKNENMYLCMKDVCNTVKHTTHSTVRALMQDR